MTALVGVLNKRGAAIAADSAMTVFGNGSTKILNNEQKIFPLSDSNPVSVMIYNNLDFLSTPIALIIDLYKSERGGNKFPSLTGYVEDFIDFIKSMKSLQSPDMKNNCYQIEFEQLLDGFKSIYDEKYDEVSDQNPDVPVEKLSRVCYEHTFEELKSIIYDEEINERLSGFSLKDFYKEVFEPNKEYFLHKRTDFPRMTDDEWELLMEIFHRYLINNTFPEPQSSGIVFVGYGENDIFPASQRIFLLGMVGNTVKYDIEEISEISHNGSAEIRPFAQTDVMLTLMKGVSPQLDDEYRDAALELESSIIDDITSFLMKKNVSKQIVSQVYELSKEKIHEKYVERIDNFMQENFINGVLHAVNFFNLEEMAKMAENLIAVTNLQRHISSSEESVGGPIEVAIITKTGGFKWIKHNNFN